MRNTKDPISRANLCVRCHVGGPDRDVNHDLIAAGHPRLNFEYHAFMANLPRHWDDSRDRELLQTQPQSTAARPADYEARLWAIGQAAAAHAALQLLEQRAQRSIDTQTAAQPEEVARESGWRHGPVAPAWPELAEFSCYSCHHALKTARGPIRSPKERKRPLGSLPWGTWYFSEVQSTMFSLEGIRLPPLDKAVDPVREAMEQPVALPKDVAAKLAGEEPAIASLLSSPHGRRIALADIDRWLTEFRDLPQPESWDEATQRYLALVAWTNSHRAFAGKSTGLNYDRIDRNLKEIRDLLRFEEDYQSPAQLTAEGLTDLHDKLLEVVALFRL
jgi:hypothetical protein